MTNIMICVVSIFGTIGVLGALQYIKYKLIGQRNRTINLQEMDMEPEAKEEFHKMLIDAAHQGVMMAVSEYDRV